MSELVGANLQDLHQLAAEFRGAAERLEAERNRVGVVLRRTPWHGAVADQFRREWDGHFTAALHALVEDLRGAGTTVARNAEEQEQTSANRHSAPIRLPASPNWHMPAVMTGATGLYAFDQFRLGKTIWGTGQALRGVHGKGPGVLDALGVGVDAYKAKQAYNDWMNGTGTMDHYIRSGVDVAWDVGSAIPVVGEIKGAWDTGWHIGTGIEHQMQSTFHHEDAILTDTMYKQYGTSNLTPTQSAELSHRYDGVSGFGHFLKDLVT